MKAGNNVRLIKLHPNINKKINYYLGQEGVIKAIGIGANNQVLVRFNKRNYIDQSVIPQWWINSKYLEII